MCKVSTFVPRTIGAETKDDVMLDLKSQSGLDTDHWAVVGGEKTTSNITAVPQINLHHSRAATATLCQKILADDIGVVVIQEPWTVKGRVMGMSTVKGKSLRLRE
nr:unnamed protein product [Callosobruchus analis]